MVSVFVFVAGAWYLVNLYKLSRLGPLTTLLFVTYALPFIHVIPYLWFDFGAESPLILWGLTANPYMTDKTIIELMAMIGAVGAAGFAVGATLPQENMPSESASEELLHRRTSERTLSMPVFLAWVAISLVLTWISAPAETVFTAAYTESRAIGADWNFSSAWMISYAFLVFALADSMFEASQSIGKLKRRIVLYTILLIVIWFQLLRGDRESLTFVLAAVLMYYVWGRGLLGSATERKKLGRPVMFFLVFVVFVVAYFVGVVRHTLVGVGSISDLRNVLSELKAVGVIRLDNLITGTWSAALLTPLSVAGDYINGSLPAKYGQTYMDLLGSIMPGFLADWIGYSRPIDALRGPAWEMTYGLGGTHAVVVPFIDFRMAGVFLIVAFWGLAFAKIERRLIKELTVSRLALLGIITTAIPHWLWYGEKYIINAFVIWWIISVLYRMRLAKSDDTSREISFRLSKYFS